LADAQSTPEVVVQRQLEAYNRHDLDAFLACYGEDARVYRIPNPDPTLAGRIRIGVHYAAHRFNVPELRAEILSRMKLGNKVIDHERVTGLPDSPVEVVAIYEVVDGLIQNVWFVQPH
jgi:hypothetical protein